MLAQLQIVARPLAPPTPNGKPGAYGIWEATATLPNGAAVWGRGLSETEATVHAAQRAAIEWREVEAHLTACELEQEAEEAGLLDARD
jgi:hypothetical protein